MRSACGMSRSHSARGNFGSQVASPALKWFFQVWMARSAALRRWTWGGTSWKFTECLVKACFITWEHSLSKICRVGEKPLDRSLWCSAVQAVVMSMAWRVFRGLDKIALLSYSCKNILITSQQLDGEGSALVRV